jgi:hypothetical protein
MPAITILIGVMLFLVGVGGYGYSIAKATPEAPASATALIPAAFGVLIIIFGYFSMAKENLRKHMMHGAMLVALLGFLGTVSGLIKLFSLLGGAELARPVAVVSQSITAILCLVLILLGVKSFIDARRKA